MALFPSRSPKTTVATSTNAAFYPNPLLLDASSALTAALDARAKIDAAVTRAASDRASAEAGKKSAESELCRIETALATATDAGRIDALEGELAAATTLAQSAASKLERAARLEVALFAAAPSADSEVAAAKQIFDASLAKFSAEVTESIANEARVAIQPLLAVMRRAHATAAMLGNLSQHVGFLADSVIPSPRHMQPALLGSGMAHAADGTRENLASSWQQDANSAALAEMLAPLRDVRRLAAAHRPFIATAAAVASYEVSHQNRIAGEFNAAADARDAARAAAEPSKHEWKGRSHSFAWSGHHTKR